MTSVLIFAIGSVVILALTLFLFPVALLLSVRLLKGQISTWGAIRNELILLFIWLLFIVLGNILKLPTFVYSIISVFYFFVSVAVTWFLVAKSFVDRSVGKILGAVSVFLILCYLLIPACSAALIFVLRSNSVEQFFASGESMSPAITIGDHLLVDVRSMKKYSPKRGDVVAYSYPKDEKQTFIHRIVGLPGEEVSFEDGKVFIDGVELREGYLPSNIKTYNDELPVKLSDNEYFVLGDNRNLAKDSRAFGPLKKKQIVGQVVFRAYPFDRFGAIPQVEY